MTPEHDDALERALCSYLDGAAPTPRGDTLPRLMERIATSPQHSAWRVRAASMVPMLASGHSLATVAVAGCALLVGIVIGQMAQPIEFGPPASPTPTSTHSPASWEEPDAYSFVLEGCGPNGPAGLFRIEVVSGVAVSFDPLDERAASYDQYPAEEMPTLGTIMTSVAEAQAMAEPWPLPPGAAPVLPGDAGRSLPEVRLVTDPLDGHPVEVYIDWIPEAIDDELCYSIHDVDVAGADVTPDAAAETSPSEAAAPSANPEFACASSGYADGKELVGAFATTVGEVRSLTPGGGGSIPLDVPDSEFAVLCYFDGEIPKGPPLDLSGTPHPSFDRIIVALVGGDSTMIVAGYQDRLAVVDPSLNTTPADLGYVRAPWVLDAVSGSHLDLRVIHGCSRLGGVDAVESEDRVEVRAWIGPTGDENCFPALMFESATIELNAPLGTRELVGCMIERSVSPYDARETCSEIVTEE